MLSSLAPGRFARRAAIVSAVVAGTALIPAQAFALNSSEAAKAKVVINTDQYFNGSNVVTPFGCGGASTVYGETIKIPAKQKVITKYTFEMAGQAASGQSMVVRGEIYAYNGTSATTAVAESKPQTIAFDNSDFNKVTFKFKGAKVKPGQQYVIFASVDKDYEKCTGNYSLTWGSVDGGLYADGVFVFQNNDGNEGNWTSTPMNGISGIDAATLVYMKK
jgi:hypothetical protein